MVTRSSFLIADQPCGASEHTNQNFPSPVDEHPALEAPRRPAVCAGCALQGQHTYNVWESIKAHGNVHWHNAEGHQHTPSSSFSERFNTWSSSHDGIYILEAYWVGMYPALVAYLTSCDKHCFPHCSQSPCTTNARSTDENNKRRSYLFRLWRIH